MNKLLIDILNNKTVLDSAGNKLPLHSSISLEEVDYLQETLCSCESLEKTFEVGCAYGVSSLAICEILESRSKSPRHIIIDPHQKTNWKSIGINNLKKAKYDFIELLDMGSEIALPEMLQEHVGTIDFAFIDGMHTFDHTLLDLFYTTKLLKVGGVVVIDDAMQASVSKAISYVLNYPCYRLKSKIRIKPSFNKKYIAYLYSKCIPKRINSALLPAVLFNALYPRVEFTSMVALQKVEEDRRDWNWYMDF